MTSRPIRAALFAIAVLLAPASTLAAEISRFEADFPAVRLYAGAKNVKDVKLRAVGADGRTVSNYQGEVRVEGLALTSSVTFENGTASLPPVEIQSEKFTVTDGRITSTIEVPMLDGLWSLLPAIFAVALALITRQVLLALFGGVWLGAALLYGSALAAFPRSLDLLIQVVADADKIKVIVFTLLMGGMVGIISASGGTSGVVEALAKRARTARSGQVSTWLLGMIIFFDDYASALLVGTTMRPITDRLKISREKLAYIVDSTAAPITSLALVSTWIGYEVSVMGEALAASGIERDAYSVFISGMLSRFYPIYALLFVLIIALSGRDFGAMLRAERRARREGKVIRDGGAPLLDASMVEDAERMKSATPRWWLAVLPIAALVGVVITVLWTTGMTAAEASAASFAAAKQEGFVRTLGFVLGNAASYDALVYGGGAGAAVAIAATLGARALGLSLTLDAFVRGLRAMALAIIVLCLAWSIGKVMDRLAAGPFVASVIGGEVPPWALPTITFLLGAIVSFATGTSWGTIAILFPIVTPVVALHGGAPGFETLLFGTTSAVLAGAVFGDHCSPISDTTVLASIATSSDHVDHTRTQIVYAGVCGAAAVVFGTLPMGFGVPPWILLLLGLAFLIAVARFVGRRPEDAA